MYTDGIRASWVSGQLGPEVSRRRRRLSRATLYVHGSGPVRSWNSEAAGQAGGTYLRMIAKSEERSALASQRKWIGLPLVYTGLG